MRPDFKVLSPCFFNHAHLRLGGRWYRRESPGHEGSVLVHFTASEGVMQKSGSQDVSSSMAIRSS